MRSLFTLTLLFFLGAQANALTMAESANKVSKTSASGVLGFHEGGVIIGGDYQWQLHRTYHVGAYARSYAKDTGNASPGVLSLGGFIRPHFYKRTWDAFITAGAGIHMVDVVGASKENMIGPTFGFGLFYQISDQMAAGVENLKIYGWFGGDAKGLISDSLVASLKFGF